jgi:hypothetical protein
MIHDKESKPNARFQPYRINIDKPLIPKSMAPFRAAVKKPVLQPRNHNTPQPIKTANIDKKYHFKMTNRSFEVQPQKASTGHPSKSCVTLKTPAYPQFQPNVYPTLVKKTITPTVNIPSDRPEKFDLSLKIFTTSIENLRAYSKNQKFSQNLFEVFGMLILILSSFVE